ncbi:MAG: PatB family C-S lyase [Campylobacterota bacterium]|nr:PatB family C-S lyase [Campylobacterota bacterium]
MSKLMREQFERVIPREEGNAEKYILRRQLFGTDNVLPMWVADMDIATPSFVTDAVSQRAAEHIYGYEEMPESAYEAQVSWMKRRHGFEMKREWMLYSPSVVATINVAIQAFTKPGDKVICQPPVYAPFFKSIANNSRSLLANPLRRDEAGDYHFDFDDLRKKIDKDTKLLLLCSPHNPVGRVWQREELEELAAICLEHGIKVLSDEIHSDLVFKPNRHIPFASLSDEVRAITATAIGPGKTFNVAGLAISTVVIADEEMRESFKKVHRSIHFAEGTVFGHVGFEAAYREGDLWVDGLVDHLEKNLKKLELLVQKYSDKISMRSPEGTYLAWIDCSQMGLNDRALRRFFVDEAKLGLNPGIVFGKEGKGFMRLNFAVPSVLMEQAIEQLDHALSNI